MNMEDILQEIGLSSFAIRLEEQNFTLQYFVRQLGPSGNSQLLRQQVMFSCGLSNYEVLAICDKIQEYVQAKERQQRLNPKPQISTSNPYAKGGSKRLSMLLGQSAQANAQNHQSRSPIVQRSNQIASPMMVKQQLPQHNAASYGKQHNHVTGGNALSQHRVVAQTVSNHNQMHSTLKLEQVKIASSAPIFIEKPIVESAVLPIKEASPAPILVLSHQDQNDLQSQASQEYVKHKLELLQQAHIESEQSSLHEDDLDETIQEQADKDVPIQNQEVYISIEEQQVVPEIQMVQVVQGEQPAHESVEAIDIQEIQKEYEDLILSPIQTPVESQSIHEEPQPQKASSIVEEEPKQQSSPIQQEQSEIMTEVKPTRPTIGMKEPRYNYTPEQLQMIQQQMHDDSSEHTEYEEDEYIEQVPEVPYSASEELVNGQIIEESEQAAQQEQADVQVDQPMVDDGSESSNSSGLSSESEEELPQQQNDIAVEQQKNLWGASKASPQQNIQSSASQLSSCSPVQQQFMQIYQIPFQPSAQSDSGFNVLSSPQTQTQTIYAPPGHGIQLSIQAQLVQNPNYNQCNQFTLNMIHEHSPMAISQSQLVQEYNNQPVAEVSIPHQVAESDHNQDVEYTEQEQSHDQVMEDQNACQQQPAEDSYEEEEKAQDYNQYQEAQQQQYQAYQNQVHEEEYQESEGYDESNEQTMNYNNTHEPLVHVESDLSQLIYEDMQQVNESRKVVHDEEPLYVTVVENAFQEEEEEELLPVPQELSDLDFEVNVCQIEIHGQEREKEIVYIQLQPPQVDTKAAACQSEYLLTYDVTCQTPTKAVIAENSVQCELLMDTHMMIEDRDMQIIVPAQIQKHIEVTPQTSPNKQSLDSQVALQEIIAAPRVISAQCSPIRELVFEKSEQIQYESPEQKEIETTAQVKEEVEEEEYKPINSFAKQLFVREVIYETPEVKSAVEQEEMVEHIGQFNYSPDMVPDLPLTEGRPSNRSSGTTTPNGGILLTSKPQYLSRTSGSVTPMSEPCDDYSLIQRGLGKKVRFATLALSDEDDQISSVKRYKSQELERQQQEMNTVVAGINTEAIITEPRRTRRPRIDDEVQVTVVQTTTTTSRPKRGSSVEPTDSHTATRGNENKNSQNIIDEEKSNKRIKKQEEKEVKKESNKKQPKQGNKQSPTKVQNTSSKSKQDQVYKAVAGTLSNTSLDKGMMSKILGTLFNNKK